MTLFDEMFSVLAAPVLLDGHGETVGCKPHDGRHRTFNTVVYRLAPVSATGIVQGMASPPVAKLRVFIPFDPRDIQGMSRTPVLNGPDKILTTDLLGKPAQWYPIQLIVNSDARGWLVELRNNS